MGHSTFLRRACPVVISCAAQASRELLAAFMGSVMGVVKGVVRRSQGTPCSAGGIACISCPHSLSLCCLRAWRSFPPYQLSNVSLCPGAALAQQPRSSRDLSGRRHQTLRFPGPLTSSPGVWAVLGGSIGRAGCPARQAACPISVGEAVSWGPMASVPPGCLLEAQKAWQDWPEACTPEGRQGSQCATTRLPAPS